MKSLILISSIFYILGLKIGYKIDLFKSNNPITKITNTTHAVKSATKAYYFNEKTTTTTKTDSVKAMETPNKQSTEIKKF